MNVQKAPATFNLKAVILETNIKPHTLRAWEERYDLLQPQRTKGNHRLYTQRDIDTVKWLMARQEEGLTISRAVELWQQIKARGEDPLNVAAYKTRKSVTTSTTSDALTEIRQKWIDNCLTFDKAAAEHVLTQAFAIYPVNMVCVEILQKSVAQVGHLWFQNEATVQQEHFISVVTVERLYALLAAAPSPNRVGRILVASPEQENHTIGLLILSLLLRYRGWEVIFFGGNLPLAQLELTVEAVKPQLVILGAYCLKTAAYLSDITQLLKEKGVNAAFGGSIFNLIPSLHQQIWGHFLGSSIDQAVTEVGRIMAFNPPVSNVTPSSDIYQRAANEYRMKRYLIELDVRQKFENEKTSPEYLTESNYRIGQNIMAALSLGDLSFINIEMDQSYNLMTNYGIPLDLQRKYFDVYYRAAQEHLSDDGAVLVEWLGEMNTEFQVPS